MHIKMLLFFILFLPMSQVQARVIDYQKRAYRHKMDNKMKGHGESALYVVPFDQVDEILPHKHKIHRKTLKLIANRMVPGKSIVAVGRHYTFAKQVSDASSTAKEFFSSLHEENTHTYVILSDRLAFAESANDPKLEHAKDLLTKHYIISGQKRRVNYSGEFHVYKNKDNGEIFVVFDNSSGTYQPQREFLGELQRLLNYNFNDENDAEGERVYFITKNFDQKIDRDKLFAKDENPFVVQQ